MEAVSENSRFVFLPELEPVWSAVSFLRGEPLPPAFKALYGAEQIAGWKQKYRFILETFQAIQERNPLGMLDFLLDLPLEVFTLEKYRDAVLSLPTEDFLWRILDGERIPGGSKETLVCALREDAALDSVYGWLAEDCKSFLAFSAFLRQSGRFIREFFALAAEMDSLALHTALEKEMPKVERLLRTVRSGVKAVGPFDFSQEQMGKVFYNRGPYREFVFLPAYLMPYRACRFYHREGERKRQLLFLALWETGRDQEDTLKALKAVSDSTRYRILTLLAQEGPVRGMDIAKRLSLAASTISHHMEQLKESGLITEEQAQNAKYYGLNRQNAAALLEDMKKAFGLQE